MDDIQHGAMEDELSEEANEIDTNKRRKVTEEARQQERRDQQGDESGWSHPRSSAWWYKYSHQANQPAGDDVAEAAAEEPGADKSQQRDKRSTVKNVSRTTCSLFIQTDPLLWRHFYEAEKRNADNTRKEITSLIAQHVKAVNAIYMETKFDGKFPHRMTRFEVQRIKIDDYEACEPNYIGEENKFCLPNIDVSNFLNLHSQGNHEDFCLAYVFTYR